MCFWQWRWFEQQNSRSPAHPWVVELLTHGGWMMTNVCVGEEEARAWVLVMWDKF